MVTLITRVMQKTTIMVVTRVMQKITAMVITRIMQITTRYDRYAGYYRRYNCYSYMLGIPTIPTVYVGGCDWLYRNAVTIGSPYWWNRYYACAGNAY